MSDQIRILRVIEYTGDREAVEHLVKQSIHGEKLIHSFNNLGHITIKAATLGSFPEVLSEKEYT